MPDYDANIDGQNYTIHFDKEPNDADFLKAVTEFRSAMSRRPGGAATGGPTRPRPRSVSTPGPAAPVATGPANTSKGFNWQGFTNTYASKAPATPQAPPQEPTMDFQTFLNTYSRKGPVPREQPTEQAVQTVRKRFLNTYNPTANDVMRAAQALAQNANDPVWNPRYHRMNVATQRAIRDKISEIHREANARYLPAYGEPPTSYATSLRMEKPLKPGQSGKRVAPPSVPEALPKLVEGPVAGEELQTQKGGKAEAKRLAYGMADPQNIALMGALPGAPQLLQRGAAGVFAGLLSAAAAQKLQEGDMGGATVDILAAAGIPVVLHQLGKLNKPLPSEGARLADEAATTAARGKPGQGPFVGASTVQRKFYDVNGILTPEQPGGGLGTFPQGMPIYNGLEAAREIRRAQQAEIEKAGRQEARKRSLAESAVKGSAAEQRTSEVQARRTQRRQEKAQTRAFEQDQQRARIQAAVDTSKARLRQLHEIAAGREPQNQYPERATPRGEPTPGPYTYTKQMGAPEGLEQPTGKPVSRKQQQRYGERRNATVQGEQVQGPGAAYVRAGEAGQAQAGRGRGQGPGNQVQVGQATAARQAQGQAQVAPGGNTDIGIRRRAISATPRVRNEAEVSAALQKHFTIPKQQADAVARVAQARAESWAETTGRKPEEWYRRLEFKTGGTPGEGALEQASNYRPPRNAQGELEGPLDHVPLPPKEQSAREWWDEIQPPDQRAAVAEATRRANETYHQAITDGAVFHPVYNGRVRFQPGDLIYTKEGMAGIARVWALKQRTKAGWRNRLGDGRRSGDLWEVYDVNNPSARAWKWEADLRDRNRAVMLRPRRATQNLLRPATPPGERLLRPAETRPVEGTQARLLRPVEGEQQPVHRYGERPQAEENPNVLYQDNDIKVSDWYYSRLGRAINNPKVPDRAPAETMLNQLRKFGAEDAELDWTGVKEYLDARKGQRVTRQDLQDWMQENQVRVTETVRSNEGELTDEGRARMYELENRARVNSLDLTPEERRELADLNRLRNAAMPRWADYVSDRESGQAKNYRELLLQLPPERTFVEWRKHHPDIDEAEARTVFNTSRMAVDLGHATETNRFSRGHWAEPNVLAHVRFDERTGPHGERVLHIAEIQSDWHNKMEEFGILTEAMRKEERNARAEARRLRQSFEDLQTKYGMNYSQAIAYHDNAPMNAPPRGLVPGARTAVEEAYTINSEFARASRETQAAVDRYEQLHRDNWDAVQDAPLLDRYHQLAVKRMLHYAADHGYDAISWDTGQTDVNRWSLEHFVDKIEYHPEGYNGHRYPTLVGIKDGHRIVEEVIKQPKVLQRYLGRELAGKLLAQPSEGGMQSLAGAEMKVGGEGRKKLIDVQRRDIFDKLMKPHGGRTTDIHFPDFAGRGEAPRYKPLLYEAWDDANGESHRIWRIADDKYEAGDPNAYVMDPDHPGQPVTFPSRAGAENWIRYRLPDEYVARGVPAHYMPITDSFRNMVETGEGFPLFQGPKGSVEFLAQNRRIIRALQQPDVSTAAHEFAHVFRRDLEEQALTDAQSKADLAAAAKWAGAEEGWTRAAEETFARGFERYLREGKAPSEALAGVFARFKQWLTGIYFKLRGTPLENEISPEVRDVFDRLLTKPSERPLLQMSEGSQRLRGRRTGTVPPAGTAAAAEEPAPTAAAVPPAQVPGENTDVGIPSTAATPETPTAKVPTLRVRNVQATPAGPADTPPPVVSRRARVAASRFPNGVIGIAKAITDRPAQKGINITEAQATGARAIREGVDPIAVAKEILGEPGGAKGTGRPMNYRELSAATQRLVALDGYRSDAYRQVMRLEKEPVKDAAALREQYNQIAKYDAETDLLLDAADYSLNTGFHRMGMVAQQMFTRDHELQRLTHKALAATGGNLPPGAEAKLKGFQETSERLKVAMRDAEANIIPDLNNTALPDNYTAQPSQRSAGAGVRGRRPRLTQAQRDLQMLRELLLGESAEPPTVTQKTKAPGLAGQRPGEAGALRYRLAKKQMDEMAAMRRLAKSILVQHQGKVTLDGLLQTINARLGTNTPKPQLMRLLSEPYRTHLLSSDVNRITANRYLRLLQESAQFQLKSPAEKIRSVIFQTLNATQRSMQAGLDISAPMIQGRKGIFANPKGWVKAWGPMLQAITRGEDIATQQYAAMTRSPWFGRAQAAGLELTEVGGKVSRQEELYSGNIIDLIESYATGKSPSKVGQGARTAAKVALPYTHLLRRSEAAYTVFLNALRWDTFRRLGSLDPKNPAYLRDVAAMINTITGRGASSVAKAMGRSQVPGAVIFAPRYMVSQWEYALGRPLWRAETGRGRAQALKVYATQAAVYTTLVLLARALGINVDTDPRSTDFGKVGIDYAGGIKLDLFAKEAQAYRFLSQFVYGKIGGTGAFTPASEWAKNAGLYAAGKAAPGVTNVLTFTHGKLTKTPTAMGRRTEEYRNKPLEWKDVAWSFAPLWLSQAAEDGALTDIRRVPLNLFAIAGEDVGSGPIHTKTTVPLKWGEPGILQKRKSSGRIPGSPGEQMKRMLNPGSKQPSLPNFR